MTSVSKTMRRLWFEMDANQNEEDWKPNAAKLTLSDEVIDIVEKAIAMTAVSRALPGAGASAERKLPPESLQFFMVWDWVDPSVRQPGSLSRGATRVRRDPWQGTFQNPLVLVSPKGIALRAWCPAHRTLLMTYRISVEAFRTHVRDMRAREMAASIDEAMPGVADDASPSPSKGPSPL